MNDNERDNVPPYFRPGRPDDRTRDAEEVTTNGGNRPTPPPVGGSESNPLRERVAPKYREGSGSHGPERGSPGPNDGRGPAGDVGGVRGNNQDARPIKTRNPDTTKGH